MKWNSLRRAIGLAKMTRSSASRPPAISFFESLESRSLLSASVFPVEAEPMISAEPAATTAVPTGNTPAKVKHAYGFDQIYFNGGTVKGDGAGQTIAIVTAYDHPTIASDLSFFNASYGLPNSTFTKKTMSTTMSVSSAWTLETAMDVEWAHAIAPGAKILLVEARSASFADLFAAVDYARTQPGVVSVSMSWGSAEFSGETSYDSRFTTPTGHIGGSNLPGGVTFVASAGDNGAPAEYPAVSPNVLSVGGTHLSIDSAGNYLGETGWSKSGGGISAYESKPAYQSALTQSSTKRIGPDVAYNGDPLTGFPVYTSSPYYGITGWFQVAGTSAGAPQWAALVAIADQGRALSGLGSLDGKTQTQQAIYSMSPSNFHDVITGNNKFAAGTGFDLVTGRGSPFANRVVLSLVSTATAAPATMTATTSTATTTTTTTTSTYAPWHGNGKAKTAAISVATSDDATSTGFVSQIDWNEWAKRHKKGSLTTVALADEQPSNIVDAPVDALLGPTPI
jgi:subtilase family serine protease